MEINPTTALTNSSASSTPQSNSLISSDFETFLQMLTAQAKYQDPLEPIDSTEYASQLAQFSSVEQQVQTNDLLNAVLSELGTSNLAEFAGWIGMDARSTAATQFDGSPVTLDLQPSPGAQEANLVVYDSQKSEVQRIPVGLSEGQFEWTGAGTDGSTLPSGNYTFGLENRANDNVIGTVPVQSYSRIGEARTENGQTILVLASGSEITPGEVTALR